MRGIQGGGGVANESDLVANESLAVHENSTPKAVQEWKAHVSELNEQRRKTSRKEFR